ncbi:hypothetical protein [Ramlibacter henchirensis]|uniref:hypothetical protein n=1 Tax=Ramlibacter henchirensis TaxID=204072 RepID=UPI001430CA93|nr:hypothetical protein [Ramlibacter henchirensis]
MSQVDLALLLSALGASCIWAACFGHLSGDRREDVAVVAATGAILAAAAAVTAWV